MRLSCFFLTLLLVPCTVLGQSKQHKPAPGTKTERFYDSRGSYAGRAETNRGGTRYYDRRGSYEGRSEGRNGTTRFYDQRGSYRGRAETHGSTTRYYDQRGSYRGRKSR